MLFRSAGSPVVDDLGEDGRFEIGKRDGVLDAIDHVLDATATAPQLDLEAALALLTYEVLDFASVYRGRRLAGMVLCLISLNFRSKD